MKSRLVAAVAAATALALAGCGAGNPGAATDAGPRSWADVTAAAKQEGAVTLYSPQHPARLDDVKKEFEKAYPEITVTVVRAGDADLTTKVDTELQTGIGIAGVYVTNSPNWLAKAHQSDAAVLLAGPDFDAPDYQRAGSVLDGKFFLEGATTFAIGWNTDILPNGLTDIPDLLNPALRGKIGLTSVQGVADATFYAHLEQNYGPDLLPRLAELQPRIYPSTLPVRQALSSGEIAAALQVAPMVDDIAKGAPVGWKLPVHPFGSRLTGMVLSTAPHPNAAQLLADFMVTRPAQVAAAGTTFAAALPGIDPEGVGFAGDIPLPDATMSTDTFVQDWSRRWDGLFRR
jgi:iron(III) transport system substrate-binding protein